MPKEYSRARRIGEQLQRELADLIAREVNDPRVGMVTITDVDVSRDLSNAKVYFTRLGKADDVTPEQAAAALNHAAGFLRRQLSHRLALRGTPNLVFKYDHSVQRGVDLSNLIDRVVSDADKDPE